MKSSILPLTLASFLLLNIEDIFRILSDKKPVIDIHKLELVKNSKKPLTIVLIPKIALETTAFSWDDEKRKYRIEQFTSNQAVVEIIDSRDDIVPIIETYANTVKNPNVIILWHWRSKWIKTDCHWMLSELFNLNIPYIQSNFTCLRWKVKHITLSSCNIAKWDNNFAKILYETIWCTVQWSPYTLITDVDKKSRIIKEYSW